VSIEWDAHYRSEREWIAKLLSPPTRAETILEAWTIAREQWPRVATEWGMTVVHDLEMIAPMRFEQIRYGDTIVIECEGVIVERTPIAK
jgi:hypothetical protein